MEVETFAYVPNLKNAHAVFLPPNYMLDQDEGGTDMEAVTNCWGGYGVTDNES